MLNRTLCKLHEGGERNANANANVEMQNTGSSIKYTKLLPECMTTLKTWGQSWYSGSKLYCRSTGQAIDPAPGASFIPKFISFAQVVPDSVYPYKCRIMA